MQSARQTQSTLAQRSVANSGSGSGSGGSVVVMIVGGSCRKGDGLTGEEKRNHTESVCYANEARRTSPTVPIRNPSYWQHTQTTKEKQSSAFQAVSVRNGKERQGHESEQR